jgi:isopentenyldiphosphate isomerase
MEEYYKQKQFIPLVNKKGEVIGQGERWDVHKKGILHKGFTVTLLYKELSSVIACLTREWGIQITSKKSIRKRGSITYKASDTAGFIEYEYCTFYTLILESIPMPDYKYAYGYALAQFDYFKKTASQFNLAPWTQRGIKYI